MALIHTLVLPLVLAASAAGPGWLGVRLAEADRPTIGEVVPDSPAAKAGMKIGDVFVSVNGTRVRGVESLAASFEKLEAGRRVRFVMLRGKKELQFNIRLAERPVEGRGPVRVEEAPKKGGPKKAVKRDPRPGFLGIEIEETEDGIVVTDLVAGGPGGRSGVRRGDKIQSFNGKRVRTIADLDKVMKGVHARDRVRMSMMRRDRRVDIGFTAAPRPGAKPLAEAKGHDHDGDGKPEHGREKKPAKKVVKQPAKKILPKPQKKLAKADPTKKPRTVVARPKAIAPAAKATGVYSDSLEKSLAKAKRSGRPVMVVFGASWCVNCETLKKSLAHASLKGMLQRYERVWIDTDRQSTLADKYKVESLPHTVFMTSQGKQRDKIIGYQPPKILAPLLRKGLGDRKRAPAKKVRGTAAKKAPTKRAQPKKAQPKKAQPKKAQPKKAQPKKAQPKKARTAQPRRTKAMPAARGRDAATANELKELRAEVQRLRAETRKQRELLNRILRELQKKK